MKHTKRKLSHKILSVFLAIAIVLGVIPAFSLGAFAAPADTRIVDENTMDSWKDWFGPNVLNTEFSGGVWTDKSVFKDASAFSGTGVTMSGTDNESFLVSLSAISANKSVTGETEVPIDTMLVLDISASMDNTYDGNKMVDDMIVAANDSIHTLLTSSKYNRVGVVLYSRHYDNETNGDNAAVVVLPLGRYTATNGQYLRYVDDPNERVSLAGNVTIEGTNTVPASTGKRVRGGTYIQRGLYSALQQFTAEGNTVTVNNDVGNPLQRKPVLVLMSDGAPTFATTNFTAPANYDLGDGTDTNNRIVMLTQLTAAYTKAKIKEKYGIDPLFYTLGLAVGNSEYAVSTLNPSSSSSTINQAWTQYNNGTAGSEVTVIGSRYNTLTVVKSTTEINKNYVDKYFETSNTATGNQLAGELKQAFADIVNEIQLQAASVPTLVETHEDVDGFISFVDKIGDYMEVKDFKGILIDGKLYSGATLASNFVSENSPFGSIENPTPLGDELVWSVQARLGLASPADARTIIGLAYQNGQFAYNADTGEYSNYIGWYANAASEYLGFWHEGITTMPNPSDPSLTDATRPKYIIKSYGYIGAVDKAQGVSETDLMYATIQVREDIETGEQTVVFSIPASLIPIVNYKVDLVSGAGSAVESVTVTGATEPIRLLYEVGLKDEINSLNVTELVENGYAYKNADGSYDFYQSKWVNDHNTTDTNTFSYFQPAKTNERYYYTEDTVVYADKEGTVFKGTLDLEGTYYRAFDIYSQNGTASRKTVYEKISKESLSKAEKQTDNSYIIPIGTIHTYVDGFAIHKLNASGDVANPTSTFEYENYPKVLLTNDGTTDRYYVGASLGNNGKLTVTPETGIKLSKAVNDDAPANTAFTFTITDNAAANKDDSTYDAVRVDASGIQTNTTVSFTNGTASVLLNAGETLYIVGMTHGKSYTVKEEYTEEYRVESVNGITGETEAHIIIADKTLVPAEFVNTVRGTGGIMIAKAITHDFGPDYQIPDKEFKIEVTLSGGDVAEKTFPAVGAVTSVTTDKDGKFVVSLKHKESVTVSDIPAEIKAQVREIDVPKGFTPSYNEEGVAGDGEIVVQKDFTANVDVINDYAPTEGTGTPTNIKLEGTKVFTGRENNEWLPTDSFEFVLQTYNSETAKWVDMGESVTAKAAAKSFDLSEAFQNISYSEIGTYYYRVKEIVPETPIIGVNYDSGLHGFKVVVTDLDMDGKLEISDVITTHSPVTVTPGSGSVKSWSVSTIFTNTYGIDENAADSVYIDVYKNLVNESGSSRVNLRGYTFGIYDKATGKLIAESDPTDIRGYTRMILDYKKADIGTHSYLLKEIVPASPIKGMTYDPKEVEFTVKIEDNDASGINAFIYKSAASDTTTTFITETFTNVYVPEVPAVLTLYVSKTLENADIADYAGKFTFNITPEGSNQIITTGTNDATGKVSFRNNLTYTKVGTYMYNINEVKGDLGGITYDGLVYTLIVKVTDMDGKLVADYTVLGQTELEVVFKNSYNAAPTDYAITVSKELSGRTLMNDEFSFILNDADSSGNITSRENEQVVKNFADGKVIFNAIPYNTVGTYYYVLEETTGDSTYGIYYDTNKYLVEIPVKDDGNGKLYVDEDAIKYSVVGGNALNEIIFENEYKPHPKAFDLDGTKTLEAKTLTDGQFSFELYEADEQFNPNGSAKQTKPNAADGKIFFDPIEFKAAGTYRYIVKEVNGGQRIKGIVYDNTVYRVTFTVKDNLRGELLIDTLITDSEGTPYDEILFENKYTVEGSDTAVIAGTKTLEGKALADNEFTFKIEQCDENGTPIEGGIVKTTKNKADKSFTFEALSFDKMGEYYFLLSEVDTGNARVTFDPQKYLVKIVVTHDNEGNILAEEPVVTKLNGEAATAQFNNTFTPRPDDINVSFNIKKSVKNIGSESIGPEDFEFTLENVTLGNTKSAVKSDKNGKAEFKLTYTEDDIGKTYSYKIYELNTAKANVSYSEAVYNVSVKIKLGDDNKLVAELVVDEKAVSGVSVDFENVYDYTPPAPPTIPTSPQTGDTFNPAIWAALFFISGGTLIVLIMRKRKA